ncbi:sporulation protein YabP [Geochorda subterranea]|uniref:Sporulation protein YabP n=1 Tax=Geochorda subterranea TaxID=3109564 RepID=A0ABZ1BPY1_9FIRM|nr:sporulation protein YabP [Limnochorda sp. LNt]WRP14764.1 sporulation protein YabP [Limnochorda sp. LNt]
MAERAERGQTPAQVVRHQLALRGRQQLELQGIVSVESFDESLMVLHTDAGVLVVRGEGMQIMALDVEAGTMGINGTIHSLEYAQESPARKARGFLSRLVR